MKTNFSESFKCRNAEKWVWYNGAMGLTDALLNGYIENSREDAVKKMANRDNVSYDEVDNDYNNWYYVVPVGDIEDEYLNEYAKEYLDENYERKIPY